MGEEDDADAVVAGGRQVDPVFGGDACEKAVRHLEQDARTVTRFGIGPRGTAMVKAFEYFERLFDDSFDRFFAPAAQGSSLRSPALDVSESERAYTVKLDLPGVAKGDVKIAIGGAPVSQIFADEIGADGYGKDAPSAIDMFLRFVGKGGN